MVCANLVNFALSLVVVAAYLVATRVAPGPLGWLPAALITQVALCLGVSLLLSALNVFFRDIQHITSIVVMAWFFLTPVIYPVEMVTAAFPDVRLHWLYYLNPMTGLLAAYRAALLDAAMPPAWLWGPSFAVAWAVLACGVFVFQGLQARFADEL